MLSVKKSTIKKVLKDKKRLEKELNVKLKIDKNNKQIFFEGDSVDIYSAERVIDALDKNFSEEISFLLLNSDYILENIPIKKFTRKTRLMKDIKARIIGKNAKSIKLIEQLSDCYITLHDNEVSIIGTFDKIREAENAIKNLISGYKHSKVYNYLEKSRKRYKPESLGLRKF
ncbi:MAG: KH domain-containing protein [Candidatus Pacearchaeota archaeon]